VTTEKVTTKQAATDPATTGARTAVLDRPSINPQRVDTAPVSDKADTALVRDKDLRDKERAAPPRHWAHVSPLATLSLLVGMVALGTTLTGLLAPEGIVLGVIGGALAAGGLIGASRRGVTGHSVALLALLCSLAAIVLGVLAISGDLSWLNSRTDTVARAHHWLLTQLPWLDRWS
jgi:hypothetical protein